MKSKVKRGAGARPQISVEDLVRVMAKPIEGRGSYSMHIRYSEVRFQLGR